MVRRPAASSGHTATRHWPRPSFATPRPGKRRPFTAAEGRQRAAGSELDSVGAFQVFDPVILDGDAVVLGELVVLRGRAVLGQDRRQLLEVALQPAGGEN